MMDHLFALLVHERPEPFNHLKRILWELCVETYSVSSCKEAQELIAQCKPHVIFAESALADGSWLSLLNIAEADGVPVNLVVGANPKTPESVSMIDRGAFDCIAPPFEHEPLSFLVKSAELDTRRRRQAAARAAAA